MYDEKIRERRKLVRRAPRNGTPSRRRARIGAVSKRAFYWLAVLLVAVIMVVGLIFLFEILDSSSLQR